MLNLELTVLVAVEPHQEELLLDQEIYTTHYLKHKRQLKWIAAI